MDEELLVCFFCKNNTYNPSEWVIPKLLAHETICPTCKKHWEDKLKAIQARKEVKKGTK